MLDATRKATTPHEVRGRLWQDNHSGQRGHKLMTKELGDTIPAIGANENAADYDAVLVPAKLFSPYNGWRWYDHRVGRRDRAVLRPSRGV